MTAIEDLFSDYTEEAAVNEAKTFRRPFFKPEKGNNLVRVMPIPRDPYTKRPIRENPWVITSEHSVKLPTGMLRCGCPRIMNDGAPCKLCSISQYFRSKSKARDDANDVMAQNFGVRQHTYLELISRKDEPQGVLLWDAGKTAQHELNRLRKDQMVGRGDFTHPLHGTDLVIHKEVTGPNVKNVKYTFAFVRESTPLAKSNEQMIEWLTNRVDFTEKLTVPTSEDVIKKLAAYENDLRQLKEDPEAFERRQVESSERREQQRRGLPKENPPDDEPMGDLVDDIPMPNDEDIDSIPF